MTQMDYNTQRSQIKLREYGRSIHDMAHHLMQIEDKTRRSAAAAAVVELMKHLNPNVKDTQESDQKVWDDLFIITNFQLDVDSPFPTPEPAILNRKPERVAYRTNNIKYRHYGRGVEMLIKQAVEITDSEEQFGAVVSIGRQMKAFYFNSNKEAIEDELIVRTIKELSGGKLAPDIDRIKEFNLFDPAGKREGGEQAFRQRDNRFQGGGHRKFHKGGHRNQQNFKKRRPSN